MVLILKMALLFVLHYTRILYILPCIYTPLLLLCIHFQKNFYSLTYNVTHVLTEIVLGHELTSVDEIHGQFEDISQASAEEIKKYVSYSIVLSRVNNNNMLYT